MLSSLCLILSSSIVCIFGTLFLPCFLCVNKLHCFRVSITNKNIKGGLPTTNFRLMQPSKQLLFYSKSEIRSSQIVMTSLECWRHHLLSSESTETKQIQMGIFVEQFPFQAQRYYRNRVTLREELYQRQCIFFFNKLREKWHRALFLFCV